MRRFLIACSVVLGGWVVWAGLSLPPAAMRVRVPAQDPGADPVVRGVYHIHSRASDGTGLVPDIAAAAARAGLRFIIVTDHGNALRRPSPPRYYGHVLCIEAVEISTTDGHYVALDMAPVPYPLGGEGRDVAEDVARLGGFGIAAHPDSARPSLRWGAWDTPIDGIEWFNADSQWRDEERWRLFPTILQYPMRPTETVVSLFDRPVSAMLTWDRLTAGRRVVGLAAADAHARMGLGGKADPYDEIVYVSLPSYEAVFRAFSLGVELPQPWTGDPIQDARALMSAIRAGHVYSAFDGIAGPPALSFRVTSGDTVGRQGDAMPWTGSARVIASANLPAGGSLWLMRNGEAVHHAEAGRLEWDARAPGAYRIEARVPNAPGNPPLPWIVSNPVYLGLPPQVRPGPSAPVVHARLVLDPGEWRIEKSGASAGDASHGTSEAGPRHDLRFALGQDEPSPFVALTTPNVSALWDASRLAFRAASSRPMRISVQVRIVDGPRQRRWQRSVYLDSAPRDVSIDFADMREAGTSARTAFSPRQIETLLFVVDTTNARPGDSGAWWIEGLRTER